MTDLEAVTHFIKRGKAQMMQMLGKEARTDNAEYEEERKSLLHAKRVLKNTYKHLEDLVSAVDAVGHAFAVVTQDFSEFTKLYEVEGTAGCDVDFLSKTIRLLQVESDQYKETIKTNGLRILHNTLSTFEPIEALHAEMRNVQLDMDVVKKDVVALETNINSNGKGREKDEQSLPTKKAQLTAITERYSRIVDEGRERMTHVLAEGNASAWSVYGIVFRQTFQNYNDNTKLFREIVSQLTSLKNQQENAKQLTEERTARMRSEHLQSAEMIWKEQQQMAAPPTHQPSIPTMSIPTPSLVAAPPPHVLPNTVVSMPDEFAAFGKPPGYVPPRVVQEPGISVPQAGPTQGAFGQPSPVVGPDDFNAFS
jgi:energy-converting hydrogenase A subunit M